MSNKPENPQAFPFQETSYGASGAEYGMTLRDYFAAKIAPIFAVELARGDEGIRAAREGRLPSLTAEASYLVADAMLAERLK